MYRMACSAGFQRHLGRRESDDCLRLDIRISGLRQYRDLKLLQDYIT